MQPVRYLGGTLQQKKNMGYQDILVLCDYRRDLKKRFEPEAKEYKEANESIQRAVTEVKEYLIGAQCEEIKT